MRNLILFACLSGWSLSIGETKELRRLTAKEAQEHVGETATVCGRVVAARISRYEVGNRGKPITLYLDKPEPDPLFFFMTWGPDPAKLEQTKASYEGKQVCVTGKIMQKMTPHILATEPSQITVQAEGKK
jgi:hypothetical protein